MIDFELEKRAITWNKFYSGAHWSVRSKLKDEWTEETIATLRAGFANCFFVKLPLEIEITAYGKRPVDPDNIASSKFIIDGIKKYFKIEDSYKEVDSVLLRSRKSDRNYIFVRIKDQDDN